MGCPLLLFTKFLHFFFFFVPIPLPTSFSKSVVVVVVGDRIYVEIYMSYMRKTIGGNGESIVVEEYFISRVGEFLGEGVGWEKYSGWSKR